jgi:hypothetical protein
MQEKCTNRKRGIHAIGGNAMKETEPLNKCNIQTIRDSFRHISVRLTCGSAIILDFQVR